MGIDQLTVEETEPATDPLDAWAIGLSGFGHSIRIRALVLFESEYSPSALFHVLGNVPLGVIAYHTRMLRDYGLVEETRTEPKRGALEHFYHRTELGDTIMHALAGMLGVPKRGAGRAGTKRRQEELEAWAYRAPTEEPEAVE